MTTNTQNTRELINEIARLALALGPYIILGALAAILIRPGLFPLPFLPVVLAAGIPRRWPGRIWLWLAGCICLGLGVYLVYGELAGWIILGASLIRGYAAAR